MKNGYKHRTMAASIKQKISAKLFIPLWQVLDFLNTNNKDAAILASKRIHFRKTWTWGRCSGKKDFTEASSIG
jgi:hypothetical protein